MDQPKRKSQKSVKEQEARFFIKKVNETNPKKRVYEDNLEEKTLLEKYIKAKKEVSEIEINERQTFINLRKNEIKVKKYGINSNNNKINPQEDRQISNLHLKINKLKEKIKEQEQEIKTKQVEIEKLTKPKQDFKKNYIVSLKAQEEQVKAKESQLYLLKYYQNHINDPEKIEELKKALNPLIVTEDIEVANQNLWLESGSQVGRSLQENYKNIKKIDEEIEKHEKILQDGIEADSELQKEIRERFEKEFEVEHSRFEKRKQKKISDLRLLWDRELDSLRLRLEDLKQKASLDFLMHRK